MFSIPATIPSLTVRDLAEQLAADLTLTSAELASRLGVPVAWVEYVMRSDAFKAMLLDYTMV